MDLRPDEHDAIRKLVFWTLAELCAEFKLPFDLMIGPIRNVYPAGVAGGRDLFDRRVSLYDYRELFNHFSNVTFPVSTLSPDAGAELVSYSWIFPNVLPMGHWWYSNIPEFIAADLRARLQAVPKVKYVGYYSDAYKLEFILPKFNMYRRILAESLASELIRGRGWSATRGVGPGAVSPTRKSTTDIRSTPVLLSLPSFDDHPFVRNNSPRVPGDLPGVVVHRPRRWSFTG